MAYTKKTFANGSTPAINATNLNNFGDGITEANPPGMVSFFANSSAPTGWLKCNGAAVSRSTYASLYTAIGTTYGSGDGSTTFNLPDLRAEFIRCLDDSRGVDSGRAIGSAQAATQILVTTDITYCGTNLVVNSDGDGGTANGYAGGSASYFSGTYKKMRPMNVALLACIKY